MPERAVGVDPPGQLDPELVLFPDLARVRLVGVAERLPEPLARGAQHRLAEAHPAAGLRLLALDVVALARRGPWAARSRRRPRSRSRSGVSAACRPTSDSSLQHLHPGQPVGVRPDRVVDAGEVDVQLAAALLQEVREEERHLVVAERPLLREEQLVPLLLARRLLPEDRLVLVPGVGRRCRPACPCWP